MCGEWNSGNVRDERRDGSAVVVSLWIDAEVGYRLNYGSVKVYVVQLMSRLELSYLFALDGIYKH